MDLEKTTKRYQGSVASLSLAPPNKKKWLCCSQVDLFDAEVGNDCLKISGYFWFPGPRRCVVISLTITRWWFQIFFIFTPTWGNDPIWLLFFKWVETTNHIVPSSESRFPPNKTSSHLLETPKETSIFEGRVNPPKRRPKPGFKARVIKGFQVVIPLLPLWFRNHPLDLCKPVNTTCELNRNVCAKWYL